MKAMLHGILPFLSLTSLFLLSSLSLSLSRFFYILSFYFILGQQGLQFRSSSCGCRSRFVAPILLPRRRSNQLDLKTVGAIGETKELN